MVYNSMGEAIKMVDMVLAVDKYCRDNDYCSAEDACKELEIDWEEYKSAKWWLQQELEQLIEEMKEFLKKKKEDEEYHKGLLHAEELRRLWDEECEEERERKEQDDWDLSM